MEVSSVGRGCIYTGEHGLIYSWNAEELNDGLLVLLWWRNSVVAGIRDIIGF